MDEFVSHWCPLCGGSSHPATGCWYAPGFVVCWRCTLELCRWLERWTREKGARKGLPFYEHAGIHSEARPCRGDEKPPSDGSV